MIVKALVLLALTVGALALVAGAAAAFAVGEVTGERTWKIAALALAGGAVYVITKLRDYAQTH